MDEILKRIQRAKIMGEPAEQQTKPWMPGMRLPTLPAVKTTRDTTQQMGGVSSHALPSLGIGRGVGAKQDGIMARIEREKENISEKERNAGYEGFKSVAPSREKAWIPNTMLQEAPKSAPTNERARMMQLASAKSLTESERQEVKKAIASLKPSFLETVEAQAAALKGDGAKQREIVQNNALAELLSGKLRGATGAAGTGVVHSLPFGKNITDNADDYMRGKGYEALYRDKKLVELLKNDRSQEENLQKHKGAYTAGKVTGDVVQMLAGDKLIRGGLGAIKGVSKLAPAAKNAIGAGVLFGGSGALDKAEAGGTPEQILKAAGVGAAAGMAGSGIGAGVGKLGTKLLFKTGLQNAVPAAILRDGLSGAAFSAGNMGTKMLLDKEYRPEGDEAAKDIAVAFAFSSISSLLGTAARTSEAKARLQNDVNGMKRDYANIVNGADGKVTAESLRDLSVKSASIRKTMGATQYVGQQKTVKSVYEFLDLLDDAVAKAGAGLQQNVGGLPGGASAPASVSPLPAVKMPMQQETTGHVPPLPEVGQKNTAQMAAVPRYIVKRDVSGETFIEIDGNILDGKPQGDWASIVRNTIQRIFGEGLKLSRGTVLSNGKGRGEYSNGKYTRSLERTDPQMYEDKMRAAVGSDGMVEYASNISRENSNHDRTDDIIGFNRGKINVSVKDSGKYGGDVLTAIYSDGKETFFDLNNIYRKDIKEAPPERYAAQGGFTQTGNASLTPNVAQAAPEVNIQDMQNGGKDVAEWRRDTMPAKADAYLTKAQSQTLGKLGEALSVPKQASREFLRPAMEELTKEYMEKGGIGKETADRLFETAYENGIMVDDDYYNTYKDLKEELRTFPVTLSATDKADIEDYAGFRRANMGKVRIVNEGGLPVDVRYQELTEKHPGLFPAQLTHPADQLRKMAEVAEGIHKTERELNAYYGAEAATFRKFAKAEFDKVLEDFTPELERVKRYSDERAKEQQKKEENMNFAAANIDGDAAAIREAWAAVKPLKKAAERATNKNLLTKQDKGTVDRLLKGEMTLEDVAAGANLKGIKAVYEAKKAYRDAMGPILQFNSGRKDALRTEAGELIGDVTELKDKGAGILYSRETMERNIRDVIKNKKTAQTVIDRYFAPVHKNEAKRTKLKNKMRDRVRELNLSRKVQKGNEVSEAAAVQIYGETASALEMIENSRGRKEQRDGESYDDLKAKMTELIEKNPKMDWDKVRNSVEQFRGIYNELFERMNSARIANGYEPVDYRAGYFPHFSEKGGDGILDQFAAALGITMEVQNLPTTINGITHTFRPGIRWSGNILQRTGNKTAYDALEGFDMYVESISDIIMHTGDIQALRALSDEIRYKASDDGIREQMEVIKENEALTEIQKRTLLNELYENAPYALSNFVVEIEEYTNSLANKRSGFDRQMEKRFGRTAYNFVSAIERRVAGNMVAINPASWLTNFIPLTQGGAELRANNLLGGMWDTLKAMKQDDGFAASSAFLTNREGSEPLVRDFWEGISAKAGHGMEIIDQFTANSLVRARCKNNMQNGMERDDALKEADTWTAGVMADRSKGSTPTLFQEKNPITKLFTMFQLEVNNQMSYLFKDIPGRDKNKALKLLAGVLLKFFIGSFLFNEAYEALIGRRPALDPIGMLNDTVGDFTGYELPNLVEAGIGLVNHQLPSLKTTKKTAAQAVTELGVRTVEELPFVGGILGGGRLPIGSALPNVGNLAKAGANLATGEGDAKKQLYSVGKELAKPGYYILPPFGGGQLKKIFEGADALKKGGSYSVNANGQDIMQYPVYRDGLPQLVGNAAKIAVFGKSSMPEARNWVESGFKSSSAPATSSYQALLRAGANGKDAYDAVRAVSAADKVAERMDALDGSKLTNAEKSAVYYGMMANDTEVELIDQLDEAGEDLGGIYEALGGIRNAGTLKGAAASNAKRNAVAGANLSDEAKIAVYRAKISDTRDEDIKAVLGAGLTFEEYLEAQNKYTDINTLDKKAAEKAVEFAHWAGKKGYTDEQQETVKEAFKFGTYMPAGETVYDKLVSTGVPDKTAYSITRKILELKPKLRKKTVSEIQKSRVIVDADMSNVDKVAALGAVMNDTELAKLDTVWEQYKVPPAQYVRYKEKLDAIDINGSITQEEAQRAMEGLVLTREQKAALYQVQNKSWKPWKNPYSAIAAEKTLNAYTRVKKQSGEEIAKQLKAPPLPPVKSQISFTGPEKTAGTLTPEERLKKMMLPEVGKK